MVRGRKSLGDKKKKDTRNDRLCPLHFLAADALRILHSQGSSAVTPTEIAMIVGVKPIRIGAHMRKLCRLGYVAAGWKEKEGTYGTIHAYTLTEAGKELLAKGGSR